MVNNTLFMLVGTSIITLIYLIKYFVVEKNIKKSNIIIVIVLIILTIITLLDFIKSK